MFEIEDYNYHLPEELIAQVPASGRESSRLLLVQRLEKSFSDHHFSELPRLLRPGDLLVANNTKVVPARLFGRKESGGQVEIVVLEHDHPAVQGSNARWCLLKSSKAPKRGSHLFFDNDLMGVVRDIGNDGLVQIAFQGNQSIDAFLENNGLMPLPPYIKRANYDGRSSIDKERYQTIFARHKGAVAAPTAGLHFTDRLLKELNHEGIALAEITLHVGYGTFRPVRTQDIRNHLLGEEEYLIDSATAETINRVRKEGRRVLAVGTTTVRALEAAARPGGEIIPGKGKTNLMIYPGFRFEIIEGLITNFHLPKSSLLFLVSAFAGLELIKRAYSWAIERAYRFYSYGDAMLII